MPGGVPAVQGAVLVRRVEQLAPDPASAGRARRLLREVLGAAGQDQWAEPTELACTELVTNAVLHAHTPITLTVEASRAELLVRVADRSPVLPLLRSYDPQATTGRGLSLVAALSSGHGIGAAGPDGKTMWFIVRGDPQQQSEQELLQAWDDVEWDLDGLLGAAQIGADPVSVAGRPGPPGDRATRAVITAGPAAAEPASQLAAGAESVGTGTAWAAAGSAEPDLVVTLLDLPPTLWLAAREHHDALLRELVLYLAEHDDPAVDLPAADAARTAVVHAMSAAVDRARQQGLARPALPPGHPGVLPSVPTSLDLTVHVPVGLVPGFAALQDVLDVAERLAAAGELLVRPGLPEIVAVRDWACEQVLAQHAGVPPARWPGADQDRFTDPVPVDSVPAARTDAPDSLALDRALLAVRDHPRPVVAADDANRIIAVSRPLAALLGWDPADLVGRRIVALIPPALREAHVAGFSRHLSSGQARLLGVPLTLPVLHHDGRELACRLLLEQAPIAGRRVYLAWIDQVP
jgi:PAS domain S-box-containing protein